ncbi:MAG: RtcB family protein [Actinomycetota bacterium]
MVRYDIKKINDYKWEVRRKKDLGMNVPGIIFADKELLDNAIKEKTIDQVINVATLPGIIDASFAMPDIHYGYGFPIGGVAAMDKDSGVISPGGVGFDISCGVRVLRTNLLWEDVKQNIQDIMATLAFSIPKGVGSTSKIKLSSNKLKRLAATGAEWAVSNGYGWQEDLPFIEEEGCMDGANPDYLSKEALRRGSDQVGTLGSGNHFLEIQVVEQVYDQEIAGAFGLEKGQIAIMIHSGSRGFGHQVCSDFLKLMQQAARKYDIKLADRQLACAPIASDEGRRYYASMACAVNFALANRQCLAHWVRESLEKYFKKPARKLGLSLLYDVSHNIAKMEKHEVNGQQKEICVHRKGATRAFGPDHPDIPKDYKNIGQPVIIPGDLGRYSYVLTGTRKAMSECFGSTCHGAGRLLSRTKAKKSIRGQDLKAELLKKGIVVMADSMSGLAEEAPLAYKDVKNVVNVTQEAGISKKILRLKPLGVIKG